MPVEIREVESMIERSRELRDLKQMVKKLTDQVTKLDKRVTALEKKK